MDEVVDSEWQAIQRDIDDCPVCLSEPLFDAAGKPARPWTPRRRGRLLLIAEDPPITGGFWQADSHDNLRENLFGLLSPTTQALETFMADGFFLVHALKRPFAKREGKRPSYNRGISRLEQTQLVEHAQSAHLRSELMALAPKAILAMGNAAWRVCMEVSEKPTGLPVRGVETLRRLRTQQDYEITIGGVAVPLNVTFLPVGFNMRDRTRSESIRVDIPEFLNRSRSASNRSE